MKKQIRNVAVIVMLASLATACQKETVLPLSEGDDANYAVNEEVKKTVNYTVDGVGQSVTLAGDDAWQEFLYRMLDMAEMGYDIRIFREDNSSRMATNKEVVVYTTADKNEAAAWCTTMYNNGYVVSMYYDSVNGVFVWLI